MTTVDEAAVGGMRRAWREFCTRLQKAGESLLDGPARGDQELAEGLRQITRIGLCALQWRLEFADPDFPVFYRHWDDRLIFAGQNVDNTYMHAQMHGDAVYRLHGEPGGREFAITTFVGDYAEIRPEDRLDERWSRDISFEADGSFDMILSAQEQAGNWLPLRPGVPCVVGLRQYYIDWDDKTIPGFFAIDRIDGPALPPPVSMQLLTRQMNDATNWLNRALPHYAKAAAASPDALNKIPTPTVTSASTFNVAYGIGHFDLRPDEALLIQLQPPPAPYWGIGVYDIWGGPPDFQNRVTSINGQQAVVDSDGAVRMVLAHTDVGHPNWLDTGGNRRGIVWYRWFVFDGRPPEPTSMVLPAERVWDRVPADTPRVTPQARRSQLSARRVHIARRFQR